MLNKLKQQDNWQELIRDCDRFLILNFFNICRYFYLIIEHQKKTQSSPKDIKILAHVTQKD